MSIIDITFPFSRDKPTSHFLLNPSPAQAYAFWLTFTYLLLYFCDFCHDFD